METDKYKGYLNPGYLKENNDKPIVKESNYPVQEKIVVSKFWGVLVIIAVIFGIAGFMYYSNEGKYQSSNNMEVNPLFNASVSVNPDFKFNSSTNNNYQNNFTTSNLFNYTIINNINCPVCHCP
jgi:hypothetical protein